MKVNGWRAGWRGGSEGTSGDVGYGELAAVGMGGEGEGDEEKAVEGGGCFVLLVSSHGDVVGKWVDRGN